ncbi:MAG: ATP-dependent DNA helicase [Candidatus Methanoperedens sp.]|nr:MAG: ATP-dependent DNA helicase [Candidatus Methanoperedens sp.]
MVELEWAYDKNGNDIKINEFSKSEKNELKPFYCPICYKVNKEDWKEVIPVKGPKNEHHFRHKEEFQHSPESIAHINAKKDLFNSLVKQLNNQDVFYAGINLKDNDNPQLAGSNNNILLINILKNVSDITLEKYVDSKRRPDICLYNKAGKPIRAIEIVVSNAPDEKKLVDLKDIELIELKIEPPKWINSKLNIDAEIKFQINRNEIHSISLPFCKEQTGDGKPCMDDDVERMLCFLRKANNENILDFEKCPIYLKHDYPRCMNIPPSGRKCNNVLHIYNSINILDLNLANPIKIFYQNSNITELYPPQSDAIKAGLLENKNIVAAIPTASGKTLLAEFVMLKSIMNETNPGKALYIVPLRALASEKYDRFRTFETIIKSSGRGVSTGIATGDFDSRDDWLGQFDIIVATSEKVDSLLRNRSRWMEEVTVVVADEIHLIDSPDRGPTLEIVLAKLRQINPRMQIIALSATIGNADEIAKWLKASLVVSEWRPIILKEGVFFGSAINFSDRSQREVKERSRDAAISLVVDTLAEGGQCLIFESSRKNTEGMASRVGTSISSLISGETKEKLSLIAAEVREASEVDTAQKLALCIENGSAFHHAGLISEQRKLIEEGFRNGIIKVISATPTLAAGLNLPARRVIIKGYRRYDADFGLTPIPVLEYKQMAGRAGRPRLDPYGESVLIAKTYDELEELMQQYVLAKVEKIWSKLGSENALRTHILSTIATGFARSMEELLSFMSGTFYSTQQEPWSLKAVIEKVIAFLVEKKFVIEKNGLFATRLGELVSRLYIDPLSASIILEGMERIEEKGIRYNELTLLHLISKTPDMRPLYLRSNDYEWISDFIMEHSGEFVQIPPQFMKDYEWFLSEVKTACVMLDWINEIKEEDIVKKFGIGEGDIRSLSETSVWLVHSMAELGIDQKRSCAMKAKELAQRVEYGASPELLELIQIRGIGRVRARKLYTAGIRGMEALLTADQNAIARIIGTKTAMKVLRQIGRVLKEPEKPEKEKQRRLGDFR